MTYWIALFLVLATGVTAAPVEVRSGDHGNYTRIVFYFDAATNWEAGRIDGGYGLRFDPQPEGFDLSRVFSAISDSHLTDIKTDREDGLLALTSDCTCYLRPFEVNRRILAVDILEGVPPVDHPYEAAMFVEAPEPLPEAIAISGARAGRLASIAATAILNEAEPDAADVAPTAELQIAAPQAPELAQVVVGLDQLPDIELPNLGGAITPETATAEPLAQTADPLTLLLPIDPPDRAPAPLTAPLGNTRLEEDRRVSEAEADLVREIARAASQGLVETSQEFDASTPELSVWADAAMENALSEAQVTLENSVLEAVGGVTADSTVIGHACLPDRHVDIAAWGGETVDWTELLEARGALLGEFDTVDEDRVITLARKYIAYGFGAEAKQVLDAFAPTVEGREFLDDMARIVDGDAPGTAFSGQESCGSKVALWAYLAGDADAHTADLAAIVRNFSSLPLYMRRHFGPGLADRLFDDGNTDAALALRNAVNRAPGEHGPGFQMLEAGLARSAGELETALAQLDDIVAQDGEEAPEALLLLFEIWFDEGTRVPNRYIELAGAMAFEFRGSSLGDRLAAAQIHALARTGGLQSALDALAQAKWSPSGEALARDSASTVLAALAEDAPDAMFLSAFFADRASWQRSDLREDARSAAAERMIALGLPQEVDPLLGDNDDRPAAQILRAKAALLADRPKAALGYLEGLSGNDPQALRAEAYVAMGEFQTASELFAALDQSDRSLTQAWRAGAWDTIAAHGTAAQRRLAETLAAAPVDIGQEVTLALSQSLLDQSAGTRTALADILAEIAPVPELR